MKSYIAGALAVIAMGAGAGAKAQGRLVADPTQNTIVIFQCPQPCMSNHVRGLDAQWLDAAIHQNMYSYFGQPSPLNVVFSQTANSVTITPDVPDAKLVLLENYQGNKMEPGYTGDALLQNGQPFTITYDNTGTNHPMVIAIDADGNMRYWTRDIETLNLRREAEATSALIDPYVRNLSPIEETVAGNLLDTYGNEDLYRRLSAYTGRTLEEFSQDMIAGLSAEEVQRILRSLGSKKTWPDLKQRIAGSFAVAQDSDWRLNYDLSAPGAHAERRTNARGAYLTTIAPCEVTFDTTDSKHPDGNSFMIVYVLYKTSDGRKMVEDRILSPGQSYVITVQVPGTYELDSFGLDEKGKMVTRTDVIMAR
jgi:hypothetical protein